MASQLDQMKKKGRAKEELSKNTRNNAVGLDARYGSGNMMLINIDLLEINEKNTRQITEDDESIQSLMQSIEDIGLQQNLVVYQIGKGDEKRFRLLSGHRRLFALRKLHQRYPDNEKYCLIPCLIVTLNGDAQKDISLDLEEKMYIAVTNVEVEGLTKKELLDSVRICMTYYEKTHAGEKKISGTVKKETATKLGISQRMLYDILKIDAGLIPEFHRAYFEEDRLQHRAARMLAGYSEPVQKKIFDAVEGHTEDLGEEKIKSLTGEGDFVKNTKKNPARKTKVKPAVVSSKLEYGDLKSPSESDRVAMDESGRRVFVLPKGEPKDAISLERDLEILIPKKFESTDIHLNTENYKKYIRAMNAISKQIAAVAELIAPD